MFESIRAAIIRDENLTWNRKEYYSEFIEYLNTLAKVIQRPLSFMGIFIWLGFAFISDPKLHPEFPELFFFRIGLSIICLISFIITYSEQHRGRDLGI